MTTRNVSDNYIKTFKDKIPDSFKDIAMNYVTDTLNKFNIDMNKYPNYYNEMAWSFNEQDVWSVSKQTVKQTTDSKNVNTSKMFYIKKAPYIIVTVIKISKLKYVFNIVIDISGIEMYEQEIWC